MILYLNLYQKEVCIY